MNTSRSAPPPPLPPLARLDAYAYRVPLDAPVATSFGRMRDRPAVFLRLEDGEGAFGWGEVFANWPAAAAEHRANLALLDVAELVLGQRVAAPADLSARLGQVCHIRALQSGEWGPFRQVIAGLDTAMHDLAARRQGLSLRRTLCAEPAATVPAYASGIHVDAAEQAIAASREAGFSAFKLKVGFDLDADIRKLGDIVRDHLRAGEQLFCDANQAFTPAEAAEFTDRAAGLGIGWLEEPIPADAPETDWAQLAADSTMPLAGGENIAGRPEFDRAIAAGHLTFLQPDVAKWGGVSGCFGVARAALKAGRVYCPHFLGGGIGLLASAHLLAAAGGPGLLEVDVNPNPLRDLIADVPGHLAGGRFILDEAPGLGIEALPEALAPWLTHSGTRTA